MSNEELWLGVSQRLRAFLSAEEYDTWFAPLGLKLEGSRGILLVPNRFFVDQIRLRYRPILEQALSQAAGKRLEIEFQVDAASAQPQRSVRREDGPVGPSLPLNSDYTFDSFVVGPCNDLAYAACQAVAAQPGTVYNPLLIFGGAGLGKTHLALAVGNHILRQHPNRRVSYLSAEAFANEMIQAVRFDGMARLREKYRQVDCLLLDDVQFLAGRERTQEEFFHTFNALFEAGKQIILTSDKIPRDIQGLEKRLRTRFEWGLMADLQPPDEETKMAILQRKAAESGVELSRQVAQFLARQPESNVRVLEGYLTRIIAVSNFQGVEVTLDLVKRVVAPLLSTRKVTIEEVLAKVCEHFGVKISDIKSSKKSRDISHPRQVAMYLARRLTRSSFPEIGRSLGGKDHSTVVKGVKKIEELMAQRPEVAAEVRAVEKQISLGGEDLGYKLSDGGI